MNLIRLTPTLMLAALCVLPACAQTQTQTQSQTPNGSRSQAAVEAQGPVFDHTGRDITVPLTAETQAALVPADVLRVLKEGNQRFLNDAAIERNFLAQVRNTSAGQYPLATILGCIDSRVPHEIIFDKGVGDIFSARVAGNFVNADMLGSLEFATAAAGSKVVVVLGHTECGAVKGACDNVELGNLTQTLSNIMPAVYSVTDVEGPRTSANKRFVQAVAHKNVDITVRNVIQRSRIMRDLVVSGDLIVVGAMHNVLTGEVVFDEPIDAAALIRMDL